jgi:hypothetical protein
VLSAWHKRRDGVQAGAGRESGGNGRCRTSPDRRERSWIATLLAYVELVLESAVAVALSIGGVILLGAVVYRFVRELGRGPVPADMLDLLSGLLLVFIFTEVTVLLLRFRRRDDQDPTQGAPQ